MRAVRSERGWSYGASSRLGLDRVRDSWSMWTHPAAEDAADCIALQLQLMGEWVEGGVSDEEVEFARGYITNGHAFAVDTAEKRLEQRLDTKLLELPEGYFASYTQKIASVTTEQVNAALKRRLDPAVLRMSVLATESQLNEALASKVAFDHYQVVPYNDM